MRIYSIEFLTLYKNIVPNEGEYIWGLSRGFAT